MTAWILVMSLLLSITGLSTETLGQQASGQLFRAAKTPPALFHIGQLTAAVTASGGSGRAGGVRFERESTSGANSSAPWTRRTAAFNASSRS